MWRDIGISAKPYEPGTQEAAGGLRKETLGQGLRSQPRISRALALDGLRGFLAAVVIFGSVSGGKEM